MPPQHFIWLGTVEAVVLPILVVVGHKRKLNERKHFSEKSPLFHWLGSSFGRQRFEVAIKLFSSLSCD